MYILFDIGGTNVRLAASIDGNELAWRQTYPRPKDFDAAMALLRAWCQQYVDNNEVTGVAGGVAGALDRQKETIFNSPNMREWKGKPLRASLEKVFKMPVRLENDADIAGLGEAVFGAGKGLNIVVYFTISTGVGGTRVVNKSIDKSVFGFEPGHQVIQPNGPECLCGGKGHLEAFISGGAVERRMGKRAYEIIDASFWEEMAGFAALGIYNSIMHWSPDIVVLGGSMMKQVGIPVQSIRTRVKKLMYMFPEIPLIEKAAFGDESGLYGALALARQTS